MQNPVSRFSYNLLQHATTQIITYRADDIHSKSTKRMCNHHQWGAICRVIVAGGACYLAEWFMFPHNTKAVLIIGQYCLAENKIFRTDRRMGGLMCPALSGHWLSCTGFWLYLISLKWFKHDILFQHLSVSMGCFCLRTNFSKQIGQVTMNLVYIRFT